MPYSEDFSGLLSIEELEGSDRFTQRFFQLKKAKAQLEYYSDDPCQSSNNRDLIGTFNLQFLSVVEDSSKVRPDIEHGFYITLYGQKQFFKAANDEDRDKWIKAIMDCYQTSEACLHSRSPSDSQTSASSSFLALDENITKSGYCVKQGIKRKNWKRRYFVLDSYGLAYYISHEETSPIKAISLADICQARVSVGIHLHKTNVFEVVTPQRVFYIQADSAFERESWINAINKRSGAQRRSEVKTVESTASQACLGLK